MKSINLYVVAVILSVATVAHNCQAFQQQNPVSTYDSRPTFQFQSSNKYNNKALGQLGSTAARAIKDEDTRSVANRLLDEFRTASGEVIDPYEVLKVNREAQRREIRESYRSLSRKYHPDGHRHKTILPGSW